VEKEKAKINKRVIILYVIIIVDFLRTVSWALQNPGKRKA
jgi:hypothetical protein